MVKSQPGFPRCQGVRQPLRPGEWELGPTLSIEMLVAREDIKTTALFGDVQTVAPEVPIIRASIPTTREKWGGSQIVRGFGVRFTSNSLCARPLRSTILFPMVSVRSSMSQSYPQGSFASATAPARVRVTPTILIAEDSADGREMMRVLLGLRGYKVLSVENGLRAVEVALTSHPDLILLDLALPRLDGLGVVRILRSYRKFRDTPIIIVSGHDPVGFRQPAIDAGCSDYLPKPIDFERLYTILQSTVPLN